MCLNITLRQMYGYCPAQNNVNQDKCPSSYRQLIFRVKAMKTHVSSLFTNTKMYFVNSYDYEFSKSVGRHFIMIPTAQRNV